jgi:hypothetical protein
MKLQFYRFGNMLSSLWYLRSLSYVNEDGELAKKEDFIQVL